MKSFRISILAALSVYLVSAGVLKADFPSRVICDYPGEQSCPAVSGSYVVWQDWRFVNTKYYYNIYHNDPADDSNTNGIAIQIRASNQATPAISGSTVVWVDSRANSGKQPDIYSCTLPSGTVSNISNTLGEQVNPVISGSIIVWQDSYNDISGDIYCNGNPAGICARAGEQSNPAISGNTVVWQDSRNSASSGMDIYRYNLDTKLEFAVCTHNGDQQNPAISGNYVVWQDNRNGNIDIYGKNLDTGVEIEICNHTGDQINPAISGDIVVWEDYRNGNADIYGYRLSTQTEIAICTNNKDQKTPAIDGTFVVWQDFRIDLSSGDIYGAHITEPSTITVTTPNGSEQFLAGSKCTISWQSGGPAISRVKLEYSTDNGQTFATIDANAANNGSYVWQPLPVIDSNQCVVRVSDKADPASTNDVSDHLFTIFKCDSALIGDLSGDCKVDFLDFALLSGQWLACGNPHDPDWCP